MSAIGWFISIVAWVLTGWVAFGFFEARGLRHDARKDQLTLSMAVYTLGAKFPLSILILGVIIGCFLGGLGVHFYWHWCPPGSISTGWLVPLITGG